MILRHFDVLHLLPSFCLNVCCFYLIRRLSSTYAIFKSQKIGRKCILSKHTVNCTHLYKGAQSNPSSDHWSPDQLQRKQPRRLCYRPAVFFLHLRLALLPLLKKKKRIGGYLKMLFNFFTFSNCVNLKLCTFQFWKLDIICTLITLLAAQTTWLWEN